MLVLMFPTNPPLSPPSVLCSLPPHSSRNFSLKVGVLPPWMRPGLDILLFPHCPLPLGPHLSLSPSSWSLRPSLRQVMLCCKEGSKVAWQVNVTLEPFFLIVLWGPRVIRVASEGNDGKEGSLWCPPETLTHPS